MSRRIGIWGLWWLVLCALWLLLVDTTAVPEVVAAIIAAAFGASIVIILTQQRVVQFQPQVGWFWLLARRLLVRCFTDSILVVGAVWRCIARSEQVSGQFRSLPFESGGADPRSAARRALVVAGLSLAPNSYVVNIDQIEGSLLVHQLVITSTSPEQAGGTSPDRMWPL